MCFIHQVLCFLPSGLAASGSPCRFRVWSLPVYPSARMARVACAISGFFTYFRFSPELRQAIRFAMQLLHSNPISAFQLQPSASQRIQRAALAARALVTLPFIGAGAVATVGAWKRMPYLGVLCFVLRALKSAFSAPRIWMVLEGNLARLKRLPEWAMSLAPTSYPTTAVRLGAMACILFLRYSPRVALQSDKSTIWSQSEKMQPSSTSLISVPIEIQAACLTSFSRSSGSTAEKSVVLALSRMPRILQVLVQRRESGTILPSSGKCQPYHSRSRIMQLLISLSSSSSRLTAWMIIVSTFSELNFSLYRDRPWPRPSAILRRSSSESSSTSCAKLNRITRNTSSISGPKPHVIPDSSPSSFDSFLSATSNLSLQPSRFLPRNLDRVLGIAPLSSLLQFLRESAVDLNRWKSTSLICLAAAASVKCLATLSTEASFLASTLKSAYPAGDSQRINTMINS